MAREQDILRHSSPKRPPRLTARRIGIHTSSAGGVHNAAERAYRLGCNAFQIFSSSPRQWAPYELSHPQCAEMTRLRSKYDLKPLVIHTNYLVNLASITPAFLKKSIAAFRGEIDAPYSFALNIWFCIPDRFAAQIVKLGCCRPRPRLRLRPRGWIWPKGT